MLVHVVLVFCGLRYVEISLLIGLGNLDCLENELDSQKYDDTLPCNHPNQESCQLVCRVLQVDDNLGLLLDLHIGQQKFLRLLSPSYKEQ